MSVVIKDNKIKMTRGDTLRVLVKPYIQTFDENGEVIAKTEYVPQSGDSIRFAVKHSTMILYNSRSQFL